MCDAAFPFDDPDSLELTLADAEVLEEPDPVAEQDRDQVNFELIEETSVQCALGGAGSVDKDVPEGARSSAEARSSRHDRMAARTLSAA